MVEKTSELWVPINNFPRYVISNRGRIVDTKTKRDLVYTLVQNNTPSVGLVNESIIHRRSVPLLVALHWLPNESGFPFDTPVQLDGNRLNCDVRNLCWRPRWFAVKYHKEKTFQEPAINFRFVSKNNQDNIEGVFTSVREASIYHGCLEADILDSVELGKTVWPGRIRFQVY